PRRASPRPSRRCVPRPTGTAWRRGTRRRLTRPARPPARRLVFVGRRPGRTPAMARIEIEVAPGVHRIDRAFTNWYLLEGDDRAVTVVDAGLPTSWSDLEAGLRRI